MITIVDNMLLDALAATAPKPSAEQPRNGKPAQQSFDIDAWLRDNRVDVDGPVPWNGGRRWVFAVCPWNPDHTNRSAFIVQFPSGALSAGCHHNGCQGNGWRELRDTVEPGWRDQRRDRYRDAGGRHRGVDDAGTFTIRRLTSSELDSCDCTRQFLIDDVLVRGEPMVIGAQVKTLKSTIAVALAISLATGRAFLGRFAVREPVRALVVNGESGIGTMQETARRIAGSHGLDLANIQGLFWSTNLPRLGSEEHLQALRETLVRDEIAALILDPLYFSLPGTDANNLMIVGGYLRSLSELCQDCGVTLVVVHHIRKYGQDQKHQPPDVQQLSWAGTAEWARQWLLLSRRADYVPGTGEHQLWMVIGGSAGHSGVHAVDVQEGTGAHRRWEVDVRLSDEVKAETAHRRDQRRHEAAEQRRQSNRAKLLKAAADFPDGGTQQDLRTRSALSGTAFQTTVDEAVAADELTRFEQKQDAARNKGRVLTFYRLPAARACDPRTSRQEGPDSPVLDS